ncbi:MAG: AAA family ATPase [Bacteroidales bacterium]|nr:AAA family ATPase [Bacteroidales bacterium]
MKILKIKFKNIHSLIGENELDFTQGPLSETGIFAIVGPTGAGKSTILDVIMLALYGQMPRLEEKISKSTIENFGAVITRNTDDAYAEVEFSTKGKNYRSKWSIRRNRNGNLNDYNMEVAEMPSGKLIETKKSEIPRINEEIIGLKYDQFLKSIVLAQGSFSKFLKSSPDKRTEMLEKITGSEIYRTIGKRAFEMAKKHRENYEAKQNLLQNFNVLTEEEKQEYIENKSVLNDRIKKLAIEIKELDEKIKVKKNIEKLTEQIKFHTKNKDKTDKEIADFQETANKLILHEKLINLKADLYEHKNLQKNISEISDSLEKASKKKTELNNTLQINELKQKEKIENLAKNQQLFENIQPDLEKYRELSKKHELTSNELNILSQNFDKTTKELIELNNQKNQLTETGNKLNLNLKSTQNWLETNKLLKELSTDYILIEEALKSYAESKDKTSKSINESIFKSDFEKGNWNNYQSIIQDITTKINENISKLKNEFNSSETIDELKVKLDKFSLELPIIEKQIENSEKHGLFKAKSIETNEKIEILKAVIDELEKIQIKTSNEIEITTKLIEELRNRYEREQLEAKYEQDRLKLEEDAPCPLCGSVHHPFAEQNHTIKIDLTKQELQKYEKLQIKLNNDFKDIISKLSDKKSSINSLNENQKELENQLSSLIKSFDENNNKLSQKFKIENPTYTSTYYKKTSEEKTNISKKISSLENLEKFKNQLQIIDSLSEKINDVMNFHIKAKDILQKYKNFYAGISKPDEILIKLNIEHQNFINKDKEIDQITNEISANKTIYNEKLQQIEIAEQKSKQEQQKIAELNQISAETNTNIKVISDEKFSGQSAENFEKKLRLKIDELKTNEANLKNIITKISTQVTENENNITELSNKLSTLNIDFEQKNQNLLQKLQQLEIESVEKALDGLLDDSESEKIRQKQKELNETKLSINQSIKDSESALEEELEKEDKELLLPELIADFEKAETEKQYVNQQIGSIITTLKNNEEQTEKLSSLKKETEILKHEYERWEALNKLIGDSQGKRFTEIAHQFTLTELISISNKHLKKFSTRYLLDKTADSKNNLFVYDTFMGMAKRSVQTLSGGETFLVSLSMALALSDLASRQTKIESLFIDEGFGTLDEQTLDQALINLEKLHNDYNRTIGLISHVPEIKERISTRIVVTKTNSGYSKISIEG